MPRFARIVVPGVAHHITQRGTRRMQVFFEDRDYQLYTDLYQQAAHKFGIATLAYCWMPNHVHIIAIPADEMGLHRFFKSVHVRYASAINQRYGWSGHLWQARFYSSPMDEAHTWAAIRYVERNPVRSCITSHAYHYPWSSAAQRCGMPKQGSLELLHMPQMQPHEWRGWLEQEGSVEQVNAIRMATVRDLPVGAESFVSGLEQKVGRRLRPRGPGRPSEAREKL